MTTQEKLNWIRKNFIDMIKSLPADTKGKWGVMNAQQMVEHMSYSVKQANGKDKRKLLTPDELLERMRNFMLSDKQFKENTKNVELPDTALPVQNPSMLHSVEELEAEIDLMVQHFDGNESKSEMNPFFGAMNYDEWVHLLH
ncbi:MAG: hypothetical protein ABI772_08080, partial [Bacteroidota bacterium]